MREPTDDETLPECPICEDPDDVFELGPGVYSCCHCEIEFDPISNPVIPPPDPAHSLFSATFLSMLVSLFSPLKLLVDDHLAERTASKLSLSRAVHVDWFTSISRLNDDGTVTSEIDISILANNIPYTEISASVDSDGDLLLYHGSRPIGFIITPPGFELFMWDPSANFVAVCWSSDAL